ncbi:MAG: S9 family peptidase, partial [Planctomycetes bacterium]|nr:S9 family peptidase [Planctomycetota bacterium]
MIPQPPVCPKHEHRETLHGITRVDPYHWLKDPHWQEVLRDPSKLDPEIRAHLEAENAYTGAALAHLESLEKTLFQELKGRIKEDDSSVPARDGEYEYYRRFETGAQYPLYCRRPTGSEDESILLDVNRLAEGKTFCQVASVSHSRDHRYLAYAVDDKGSEFYTVHVVDLDTGESLSDELPHTAGNFVWAGDSSSILYTILDDNHRPQRIACHRLGDPIEKDRLIYDEPDPGFFVHVDETESREYLLIHAHDHTTSEIRWLPAKDPAATPVLVAERRAGVEYEIGHHDDRFFILLREGDAKDGAITTATIGGADRSTWAPYLPHQPGRLIEGFLLFRDHLVRLETVDALPRLVVRKLSTGEEHTVAFDEEAYDLGLVPGYEFDTTTLRFTYSSMTTPHRVYDYDLETRERVLRKEQEV